MPYEINMTPSALADIEEIFEWYNKEAADLDIDLLIIWMNACWIFQLHPRAEVSGMTM